MVKKIPQLDRRKALKLTGLTLAGMSSVGAASAKPPESSEANVPNFVNEGMGGYAIGDFNSPVTGNTINRIHKKLARNPPNSRDKEQGVILPDPTAKPRGEYEEHGDEQVIIGYGIKWSNGALSATVKRATKTNSTRPDVRQQIKNEAHTEVLDFIDDRRSER